MSRRIAASSVNWTALAERVPKEQRTIFITFKAKSDSYLRRVMDNPPEPPKIDWVKYKSTVPIPGMVETFQKQYEALKIPYPPDNVTALVDKQAVEMKSSIEKFIVESNARISGYEKELAVLGAMIPYDSMTMEDFYDAHRDCALAPLEKPTYWPHDEAEQLHPNDDAEDAAHEEH